MNTQDKSPEPVPKLLGADVELANFMPGRSLPNGTGAIAAKRLLSEIEGFPGKRQLLSPPTHATGYDYTEAEDSYRPGDGPAWRPFGTGPDPQDYGRKFLANGGCAYIDLDHLEVCTAEALDAREHVAALRAMLEIARCAQETANKRREPRDRISVIANNSDGLGSSYGSHMSVCADRRAFDDLCNRKLHHLLFLASYQVSSIIFTGQGKVGHENNTPPCDYQISQRADFFETLMGHQTTHTRPIVNLRDEALVGWKNISDESRRSEADRLARLHIIFYDNALCQTASFLRAGMMQIAMAMIERGQVDISLILDDPVAAVVAWSHDPELQIRMPLMVGNRSISAVEWQLRFAEQATRFVASGACDGIVPNAREILDLYTDTIERLHARRLEDLAPRIDWILKRMILRRALADRNLGWDSPQAKHLDQLYGSLEDGLFWRFEEAGHAEKLVSDAEIERLIHLPPSNTRAWLRGMILRGAETETIDSVNWDLVCLRERTSPYGWERLRLIHLNNPFHGEAELARDDGASDPQQQPQAKADCMPVPDEPCASPAAGPRTPAKSAQIKRPAATLTAKPKHHRKQREARYGKTN